jgi:hypothetical protein
MHFVTELMTSGRPRSAVFNRDVAKAKIAAKTDGASTWPSGGG